MSTACPTATTPGDVGPPLLFACCSHRDAGRPDRTRTPCTPGVVDFLCPQAHGAVLAPRCPELGGRKPRARRARRRARAPAVAPPQPRRWRDPAGAIASQERVPCLTQSKEHLERPISTHPHVAQAPVVTQQAVTCLQYLADRASGNSAKLPAHSCMWHEAHKVCACVSVPPVPLHSPDILRQAA